MALTIVTLPARIAVNPIVVRHAYSGGYASPDLVSVIPFSQFHGHASGVFDSAGPFAHQTPQGGNE